VKKSNNLIPHSGTKVSFDPPCAGAKARKEELNCLVCAFNNFAPLREMLLLSLG
jgi:hypothetical protein